LFYKNGSVKLSPSARTLISFSELQMLNSLCSQCGGYGIY